MWHTGERRFVRHVCFRNPLLPFLLGIGIPSIHYLPEAGFREQHHTLPSVHYACTMLAKDSISLSKIPDLCHMQKSIGLVTELWSPKFVTEYWNVFFSHLPCRLLQCVEIELLATVGWSGAASLSAADVCKMWRTAETRLVRHVCLGNPF